MKPVVLIFTRYYLPGYRAGGPIRAIFNVVTRLGTHFDFRVVTSDRDMGDVKPYANVLIDTWVPIEGGAVKYVPASRLGILQIRQIIRNTPHDLIYLNSFFDPKFTLSVLLCRRYTKCVQSNVLIAPRGELSVGALRLKAWRKSAFLRISRWLGLHEGLTWQASSDFEAADIHRVMSVGARLSGRIQVVGHLGAPNDSDRVPKKVERGLESFGVNRTVLQVCTLSRISPIKNLEFSLDVLRRVSVPVEFVIYGPVEDVGYWAICQKLMASLPRHVSVVHRGAVLPEEVVDTLAQHDLFLLPTRGENFGYVILEALRAGLPLLISDLTPWRNLDRKGVGWELPLSDAAAYVRCIEEVYNWGRSERRDASDRALQMAAEFDRGEESLESNKRLILEESRWGYGGSHGDDCPN